MYSMYSIGPGMQCIHGMYGRCYVHGLLAGLLANLTCLQAELYGMEKELSVKENPLWVVPYSTVAADYQDLLQVFGAYAGVHSQQLCITPNPICIRAAVQALRVHHICIGGAV